MDTWIHRYIDTYSWSHNLQLSCCFSLDLQYWDSLSLYGWPFFLGETHPSVTKVLLLRRSIGISTRWWSALHVECVLLESLPKDRLLQDAWGDEVNGASDLKKMTYKDGWNTLASGLWTACNSQVFEIRPVFLGLRWESQGVSRLYRSFCIFWMTVLVLPVRALQIWSLGRIRRNFGEKKNQEVSRVMPDRWDVLVCGKFWWRSVWEQRITWNSVQFRDCHSRDLCGSVSHILKFPLSCTALLQSASLQVSPLFAPFAGALLWLEFCSACQNLLRATLLFEQFRLSEVRPPRKHQRQF